MGMARLYTGKIQPQDAVFRQPGKACGLCGETFAAPGVGEGIAGGENLAYARAAGGVGALDGCLCANTGAFTVGLAAARKAAFMLPRLGAARRAGLRLSPLPATAHRLGAMRKRHGRKAEPRFAKPRLAQKKAKAARRLKRSL